MSGTQDNNLSEQNSQNTVQASQSGIDTSHQNEGTKEEKLSPSQKMDRLIRGTTNSYLKKEIEKLRKEAAKYRTVTRNEVLKKIELQKKSAEIQKELDELKETNRHLKIVRELDKAGCKKSELVFKDVPNDCENLEEFIKNYKEENQFLFSEPPKNIGSTFKTSGTKNLSAAQKMDAYIRAALGR